MSATQPHSPLVSVVIPCRNEADCIERCLASVLAQEEPEGGFEVIVADGMSEDGTRQIVERVRTEGLRDSGTQGPNGDGTAVGGQRQAKVESAVVSGPGVFPCGPLVPGSLGPLVHHPAVSGPQVRVIDNPGRIVSTGLNAAIRAARGDIIIRMDAHTEYAPDYIRRCVETLRQTGADNVGGPARTKASTFRERAVAAAYHSPFSVGGARFHDIGHEGWVDTVTYGCWRREAFERFGYFDEELVRNQDDEHNLRIMRGGGRIWQDSDIKSWYRPRGSLSALFRQYMQYGYWKVRVIQKHKLPASWRHLVPVAFVLTLLFLLSLSILGFLWAVLHPPVPGSLGPWVPGSLFLLLSCYVLCLCAASIATAAKSEWKLLPVLPFVFGCYHFGYGWGFLRGVLDFVVLRRGAGVAMTRITRAAPATTD